MENFYLGWMSPVVNNILVMGMRAIGESVVDSRPAGDLLEGRSLTILVLVDMLAQQLKSFGIPIPEYGIGSFKIRNFTKIGLVSLVNNFVMGPMEVYTRTENG